MPLTLQPSYDQHQSMTKFKSTLEIMSHQLCYMNRLPLFPANYFNFAAANLNLNVFEYLSYLQTYQCRETKFCYEAHDHVIRDLRVTENAKLKGLYQKDQNTENQIGSIGKLQKQCFWNKLISMQKIGPNENKQNSNISLNAKAS